MHRNRTWSTSQSETRTQRNRILPIIGGNGSAFGFDFTSTNETLLKQVFTFTRSGTNATYLASNGLVTTAGANVPRFDFSEAGQSLGILLEGNGKNWCTYSEDQSNGAWIAYTNPGGSPSITKNGKSTFPAPDGSLNGNKLTITGTGNNGLYQVLNAALLDVVKTITVSVWVYTESGTGACRINYFNPTVGSAFGPTETITTKPRRIKATFPITSISTASNTTISNAGGDVVLVWWGYQVEEAFETSSYIKTTTAAATRSSDALTVSGINTTWFNHIAGTAIVSFDLKYQGASTTVTYPRIFVFGPAVLSDNPTITVGRKISEGSYFVNAIRTNGTATTDTYTPNVYNQNTPTVLGISYGNVTTKTSICVNGDTPNTTTNLADYQVTGISQLGFTRDIGGLVMHIKFFQYWKESKAPAELQGLVNNAKAGFSPAPTEPLFEGNLGYISKYNSSTEAVYYASPTGGAEDDFANAGLIVFNENVDVGFRPVLTNGSANDLAIVYNIDDTYAVSVLPVNFNTSTSFLSGQSVAFGLGGSIAFAISGRIEIYEYTTKQTILAFQFNT